MGDIRKASNIDVACNFGVVGYSRSIGIDFKTAFQTRLGMIKGASDL